MRSGDRRVDAGVGTAETAERAEARTAAKTAGSASRAGLVIGLLGPTGVGKTSVGVALAKRLGEEWLPPPYPPGSTPGAGPEAQGTGAARPGRIISCDSMQVYRGFPALTNQPTDDEMGTVFHAAVGFVDPDRDFSVAQYAAYVKPLIEQDLSSQGWALIVGGTGLYMRAALAPLALATGADSELRARLEARAAEEGVAVLYGELARLDPAAAAVIDPRNGRRVVRALEVITLTGGPWSGRDDLWTPAYSHPTLIVGLVTRREELYRRIDSRAERILQQGAVEEVRSYRETRGLEATGPGGPGIRSAIGYPEICRFLDDQQTLEETAIQLAAATRRYARRQLTWLRKLGDAVIIDVQDREPLEVAQDIVKLARSSHRTRESHRS